MAPTYEEIAQLAYQLWEERGRPNGSPEIDWERAEAALQIESTQLTQTRIERDESLAEKRLSEEDAGASPTAVASGKRRAAKNSASKNGRTQ